MLLYDINKQVQVSAKHGEMSPYYEIEVKYKLNPDGGIWISGSSNPDQLTPKSKVDFPDLQLNLASPGSAEILDPSFNDLLMRSASVKLIVQPAKLEPLYSPGFVTAYESILNGNRKDWHLYGVWLRAEGLELRYQSDHAHEGGCMCIDRTVEQEIVLTVPVNGGTQFRQLRIYPHHENGMVLKLRNRDDTLNPYTVFWLEDGMGGTVWLHRYYNRTCWNHDTLEEILQTYHHDCTSCHGGKACILLDLPEEE